MVTKYGVCPNWTRITCRCLYNFLIVRQVALTKASFTCVNSLQVFVLAKDVLSRFNVFLCLIYCLPALFTKTVGRVLGSVLL